MVDSHPPIPYSGNQHENETDMSHVEPETADFDTAIQSHTHTSIPPDAQTTQMEYGVQTGHESETQNVYITFHEEDERLVDVEGDCDEGNEDESQGTPLLYEPTSPLHLMPTGILQDIAEETEGDTECEQSWSNLREGGFENGQLALQEVEYAETQFFDLSTVDSATNNEAHFQPNETPPIHSVTPPTHSVAPPPTLPVSPPPGPVLSPRLSMLLAEASPPGPSDPSSSNRLSVASLSGEAPPPLPSSLPPGKLISPRHSLMEAEHRRRPDSITTGDTRTGLDMALLSQRLTDQSDAGEEEKTDSIPPVHNTDQSNQLESDGADSETETIGENEEPLLITTIDEVDDPPEEDFADEALPPPVGSADEETPNHLTAEGGSKLKITPSFLRSLEPPREFSDSSFPDTDHENTHLSTPEQGTHTHSNT